MILRCLQFFSFHQCIHVNSEVRKLLEGFQLISIKEASELGIVVEINVKIVIDGFVYHCHLFIHLFSEKWVEHTFDGVLPLDPLLDTFSHCLFLLPVLLLPLEDNCEQSQDENDSVDDRKRNSFIRQLSLEMLCIQCELSVR